MTQDPNTFLVMSLQTQYTLSTQTQHTLNKHTHSFHTRCTLHIPTPSINIHTPLTHYTQKHTCTKTRTYKKVHTRKSKMTPIMYQSFNLTIEVITPTNCFARSE